MSTAVAAFLGLWRMMASWQWAVAYRGGMAVWSEA